jgi:hypothetical protein
MLKTLFILLITNKHLQWLAEHPGKAVKDFSPSLLPETALGIEFVPRYGDPISPALPKEDDGDEAAASRTSDPKAACEATAAALPPVRMVRTARGQQAKVTINAVIKWATDNGLRVQDDGAAATLR